MVHLRPPLSLQKSTPLHLEGEKNLNFIHKRNLFGIIPLRAKKWFPQSAETDQDAESNSYVPRFLHFLEDSCRLPITVQWWHYL